jgi:hypothetical protein
MMRTPSDLTEFWQTTWSVWRTGALSPVSRFFAQTAQRPFEEFLKTSGYMKNPFISEFFTKHPPRPNEFLIGFVQLGKLATMVLTNQRLWMYDKRASQYVALELADVAAFSSRPEWWTHKVTLRFKDNTERIYEKIASIPSDAAVRVAIERCIPGGSGNLSAAPSDPYVSTGAEPTPIERSPSQPVAQRFLWERVAFIAVASVVAGLLIGTRWDAPVVGVIAITAFLLTGVYIVGKMFMGVGGFFEILPPNEPSPAFDWRKFLLEPLYFLGVAIAVFLFVGAVIVFREYIWPIMKG